VTRALRDWSEMLAKVSATKQSPATLQKHSLVSTPCARYVSVELQREAYRFAVRFLVENMDIAFGAFSLFCVLQNIISALVERCKGIFYRREFVEFAHL